MKIKSLGYTDQFIQELMLETGESGTKPSIRLMEAIGDRWMKDGIQSRQQAKDFKNRIMSTTGGKVSNIKTRSGKPNIDVAHTDPTLVVSDAEYAEMMRLAEEIQENKHNPGA